ncbi:MAG TPA: cytochrome C [Alphaproteobacteria bacterium]
MRMLYLAAVALCVAPVEAGFAGEELPHHRVPPSPAGNMVVALCDGETSIEVPGKKPGDTLSRDQAQQVADALMSEWRRKHHDAEWITAENEPQHAPPPRPQAQNAQAPTSRPVAPPKPAVQQPGQVQTYGAFTDRDREIWRASTEQLVAEGDRIFHDAKALGSTDGISCDMCHPNAANTHPESYPKYQVQLGRVAMLRDMVNWCIENPVRGKPLADDDPKLKAIEAYIIAQRRGVALDYGKH